MKRFRLRYTRCTFSALRYCSRTRKIDCGSLSAAAYQPKLVENNKWEANKLSQSIKKGDVFSMVLPPPNVTGRLHLGHALACTIQDVIIRKQKSLGKDVLWLPGTDHAGIATQGVVEKYLKNTQNIDRHKLGREKFNLEVWKWKETHGNAICDQLKKLGSSLDWSKLVFTMDQQQTAAVNEAFIRLFDRGLIYRKTALINWSVQLKSTISDIEVENFELVTPQDIALHGYAKPVRFGEMTEFFYRVVGSGEEVPVATTRLETMLGDVALAVHPDDNRYKHLHNTRVHHPFRNVTIPVIADHFVDKTFGTGVVKITPAHDKTDYEVAQRHDLPTLQVIDEDGLMNEKAVGFERLPRYECRRVLKEKLNDLGMLKDVVPHKMSIPRCSRTGDVIEVLPKEQWFVNCKAMNSRAIELVKKGDLRIHPDNFVKKWDAWTRDERDWCVSRQLWWGHRIPAYECQNGARSIWVGAKNEEEAKRKAADVSNLPLEEISVRRDEDVLDTWFSSGIYPFSALGWPDSTDDLQTYYPLSLMATGHDILGFWVHRMVILGLELTGKLPFSDVLLHGIVCDGKGAKMSKSRGNVIDPIDVIEGISLERLNARSDAGRESGILSDIELQRTKTYNKSHYPNGIPECGADALRFTLLSNDIKSHFVHFDVDSCYTNKLFCNKIWQSVKYARLSFEKLRTIDRIDENDLDKLDRWILSRLSDMVDVVNESVDCYDFHIATAAIRNHIYSEFCDTYIEMTKLGFEGEENKKAYGHAHTLSTVLNVSLRCLSPFMPYVSEELIPKIPGFEKNIIHNFTDEDRECFDLPMSKDFRRWRNENVENDVKTFIDIVSTVRRLKGTYGIPNRIKPRVVLDSIDASTLAIVRDNKLIFNTMTRTSDVCQDGLCDGHVVSAILNKNCTVRLVLEDNEENTKLITSAKERLVKRVHKLEQNMTKVKDKMSNSKYAQSTPESVQTADKDKLTKFEFELKELARLLN